jgi:tetratricopeptide (TPR) repeat protein
MGFLAPAPASLVAGLAVLAACGTPRALAAAPPAPPPTATEPAWPPLPPSVALARARALRAEGDVAAAQARLEAALATAPAYDDARLELADILLSEGSELDRAAALLAGVRAPGARGHLLSARLAELRADDAGAAAAYASALEVEDDPDVRLRRALALDRLGRPAEAIRELERVRAARPDDAIARTRLAALYEAGDRLDEAEAEYRALAEARPERAQGWEDLARFCERAGRLAHARAARERARAARGATNARELRPLPPSKR